MTTCCESTAGIATAATMPVTITPASATSHFFERMTPITSSFAWISRAGWTKRIPIGSQTRPKRLRPRGVRRADLGQDCQCVALRLEDRLGDVAQVLPVGLERARPFASDHEAIEVMPGEDAACTRQSSSNRQPRHEPRQRCEADLLRRSEVESELEAGGRGKSQRHPPRIGE